MARNSAVYDLKDTQRLMGALVRKAPKPHDDMKVGKSNAKPTKSPQRKRGASSKTKTA